MDPITAGLFVAASFATSLNNARNSARIERSNIKLQTEQARLQTAEQAYERSKEFRQNLSYNLALSGMGKGGVSGFKGVAAESISDYFADVGALGRQDVFAQLSGQSALAGSKVKKRANVAQGAISAAQLASDLGLFKGSKA